MIEIKVKPLCKDFQMPKKHSIEAAGFDVYLPKDVEVHHIKLGYTLIPLGFAMEIPKGYCAKLMLRSSINTMIMAGGLIDSDYRGELFLKAASIVETSLYDNMDVPRAIKLEKGTRVCQLVIEKVENTLFVFSNELSETLRRSK